MTALPCQAILGTPGLDSLPAPEWPGTHDEARGSVPPSGPALVTCRRKTAGVRCSIPLKPGWIRGYLAHTVKPASPHYPKPWRVGEIEPASVREVVESHMPEGQDPTVWRSFWGVEP
jgi:hypothetical protein